jgi:hypothetical protein
MGNTVGHNPANDGRWREAIREGQGEDGGTRNSQDIVVRSWAAIFSCEVEIIADLFKLLGRHQVVGLLLPVVKHPSPARNREETSARQGDCHGRSRRINPRQAALVHASPTLFPTLFSLAGQERQGGKGTRIIPPPWMSLHQPFPVIAAGCEQHHNTCNNPQCKGDPSTHSLSASSE